MSLTLPFSPSGKFSPGSSIGTYPEEKNILYSKMRKAKTLACEFMAKFAKKVGHRPQKPDSVAKVAEAIGFPKRTLLDSKQ